MAGYRSQPPIGTRVDRGQSYTRSLKYAIQAGSGAALDMLSSNPVDLTAGTFGAGPFGAKR